MRGDDPYLPFKFPPAPLFAPHARGCSAPQRASPARRRVCPACAGMIRFAEAASADDERLPRMRGDDPANPLTFISPTGFAPHARG